MKIWEAMSKGLKGSKNELADANTFLRDLKYKMGNIETQLRENKAISDTLPTTSLLDLLPFRSDDDLCKVLDDENLFKALYAKVTSYTLYLSFFFPI